LSRQPSLDFLKTETGAGMVLILAAAIALIAANSPLAQAYWDLVHAPLTLHLGSFDETKSVQKWIKDGLMAVFFYAVGLEIKHEIFKGELSSPRKLALPLIAALGGMIGPALVYLAINLLPGGALRGWPVPVATDIAFALAILALVGKGLPPSLRLFLLTLAIVDDLGAVALIAVLFTSQIKLGAVLGAAAGLAGLALLARWKRAPLLFYAAGLVVVWAFTLKSGINTSLAGVACAMLVPVKPRKLSQDSLLTLFNAKLHPYVAYGILPAFAFTAAGFQLNDLAPADLVAPVPLGIAAGLFFGKAVAVFAAVWLAVRLGLSRRPHGASWLDIAGVSVLCGIGFTMSLFIGALAFPADQALVQSQIRLGVIAGSVISAFVGFGLLKISANSRRNLDTIA
jgi:NhaA family Na+:H+ antiporter